MDQQVQGQEPTQTPPPQTEGQQAGTTDEQGTGGQDLGWTDEQKAYIESLRKESAKYRTRSKELETQYSTLNDRFSKFEKGLKGLFGGEEGEEMTPEQTIETLSTQNETLVLNNALVEAALEYGIGKEDFSYFKFLVSERLSALEDGDELTEEDLDAIARQSRRGRAASTSVDGGGTPPPEAPGGTSLESFMAMGINERSALFAKNEALYKQLVAQERAAKAKK